jgi:hypothetical protein
VDTEQVLMLKAQAVRWLCDEPIPGLVEVAFVDADGVRHVLVDKSSIFGSALTPGTPYPVDVLVGCEVLDPPGDDGRVLITTERPWGIETAGERSEFVVAVGQLVWE